MLGKNGGLKEIGRRLWPHALWDAFREGIGILYTLGFAGLITAAGTIFQWTRHHVDIVAMAGLFVVSALLLVIGSSIASTSNATDIERLEFYLTRDKFESVYKFDKLMKGLTRGSTARFVGVTLFHLMNKLSNLKCAVEAGATVQLCLIDPRMSKEVTRAKPDFNANDVYAALSEFRKMVTWLDEVRPLGSIELRFHRVILFDSFFSLRSPGRPELACWDLSFGRDTRDKRVAPVNATQGIGQDLCARYLTIWENASNSVLFLYHNRKILIDREELFPAMHQSEEG